MGMKMKRIGRRKLKKISQDELNQEIDAILEAIHDDILLRTGRGRF
jgi:hypothetical protein